MVCLNISDYACIIHFRCFYPGVSKLLVLLWTRELKRRLEADAESIAVICADPSSCFTGKTVCSPNYGNNIIALDIDLSYSCRWWQENSTKISMAALILGYIPDATDDA